MHLKLKFSVNDFAYFLTGESINRILIKSIETKTSIKEETEIKYISSDKTEHLEPTLLSKRELIELLNNNGY